jgi:hypothetical protein
MTLGRPEALLANLEIIERAPRGVTCGTFAKAKWPGRRGSRLNCAAGAMLGALWTAGLVRKWGRGGEARYALSPYGIQRLLDFEAEIARAPTFEALSTPTASAGIRHPRLAPSAV